MSVFNLASLTWMQTNEHHRSVLRNIIETETAHYQKLFILKSNYCSVFTALSSLRVHFCLVKTNESSFRCRDSDSSVALRSTNYLSVVSMKLVGGRVAGSPQQSQRCDKTRAADAALTHWGSYRLLSNRLSLKVFCFLCLLYHSISDQMPAGHKLLSP